MTTQTLEFAGNFTGPACDCPGVNCETARAAISALIDDEHPGAALADLEFHLGRCRPCREWRDDAYRVTRRCRIRPAESIPKPDPLLTDALTKELGWSETGCDAP